MSGSVPGGEKFCLKWNEFDSNLHSAFKSFREEKSFCDVSLLCENFSAEAHRVILSASSEFFKSVFQKTAHQQHPFIYIKGIKPQELSSLIQFMYQGEVNIAQEDLQSFLAAAEELKVSGLSQNSEETSKDNSYKPPPKSKPNIHEPDVIVPKVPNDPFYPLATANDESIAADDEEIIEMGSNDFMPPEMFEDNPDIKPDELIEKKVNEFGVTVFECKMCKKTQKRRDHMKNHIQTHFKLDVRCPYCGVMCKNPPSLSTHITQRHRSQESQPQLNPGFFPDN